MPNRIIKESICTSENIDSLTPFQETFFYRLIVNCDDFGRMDARSKILAARLFPLKDVRASQIEDALRALTSAELVTLYMVDGKPFLQMNTWDRHQQVRNHKSKYPSPDASNCEQLQSIDINCNQVISDDSKCSRNPIQSNTNPNQNTNTNTNTKGVRFAPPTLEEVEAYCKERGNKINAQHFIDYYEARGWVMKSGQKVKNWKACIRTWEASEEKPVKTKTVIAQQYEQRDYSGVQEAVTNDYAGEIERRLREKNRKKVLAQMYDQRDYSGVQDELMKQQDRDMEEYLRKEQEKGANNNAESNSTADVLPDDSEWLFNGTG